MCKKIPLAMLGLMTSLTLGCDKQEATPPAPSTDTTESVLDSASDQVTHSIRDAGKDVTDTLDATMDDAAEQVAQVKEDIEAKVDAAKTQVAELADSAAADAQPLIDQAMGYIKDNKFDLAEKALEKLDQMKSALPESIQSQIASLHSALDAAKSLGSAKSVGGLGDIKLPGTK